MKQQQLDEIKARCEAATRGPWTMPRQCVPVDRNQQIHTRQYTTVPKDADDKFVCQSFATQDANDLVKNGIFIAHARQDIPVLLAHIVAQEAENARLREALALSERDLGTVYIHTSGYFLCEVCDHYWQPGQAHSHADDCPFKGLEGEGIENANQTTD